jgi:pyridoxal phosphate enzyme (YggS family)
VPERLASIRARIAAAAERSGRDAGKVRLVAVTKGVDAGRISAAVSAGVTDLGENRVQEAQRKHETVSRAALTWHMLGHVQANKAAPVAALFDVVHSVDSERIARRLLERRDPNRGPLGVFIEVELTGISGRSGVAEHELAELARAVAAMPAVQLLGLMTIAAPAKSAESARPTFRRLRSLRDAAQESSGRSLPELSMGMSDDFEVAVEEGATVVRIGRALFGDRAGG